MANWNVENWPLLYWSEWSACATWVALLIYYCVANYIVTISRQHKLHSEWAVKVPKLTKLGQIPKFYRILFMIAFLNDSKFYLSEVVKNIKIGQEVYGPKFWKEDI